MNWGDILFVYVHTTRSGSIKRNAILFQAKVSAKQPYKLHSSENNQLFLYEQWPDFIYKRSSFLNGQQRTVTPKTPHSGAQYLLIDDRPPEEPESGLLGFPGTYPVGCCMPDETLLDHTHLADELFSLITFRTGRPFDDNKTSASSHDWSRVIWDLLESGMKKTFNRKNSGRHHTPRVAGDTIQMMDGLSFSKSTSRQSQNTATEILGKNSANLIYGWNSNFPPRNNDWHDGEEGTQSGVSLVLIETSEREFEG